MPRTATQPPGAARRLTVGRRTELAELRAAFESAAKGSGSVVCISGEAGVGKSTLLDEFSIQLGDEGAACFLAKGRCSERLAGSEAYLPLLEAFESLARSYDAVAKLLMMAAPTWYVQIAPYYLHKLPDSRLLADVKVASQERLKRELVAFFDAASRLQPFVLFLDDMHWADASTTDLMAYLGSRIAAMRILIVTTYRGSDLQLARHPFLQAKQELQAHGCCREIALELLGCSDVKEYLSRQFP